MVLKDGLDQGGARHSTHGPVARASVNGEHLIPNLFTGDRLMSPSGMQRPPRAAGTPTQRGDSSLSRSASEGRETQLQTYPDNRYLGRSFPTQVFTDSKVARPALSVEWRCRYTSEFLEPRGSWSSMAAPWGSACPSNMLPAGLERRRLANEVLTNWVGYKDVIKREIGPLGIGCPASGETPRDIMQPRQRIPIPRSSVLPPT